MKPIHALIIDDDRDDRDILKQQFLEITNAIRFTEQPTGDEALAYFNNLKGEGATAAYPDIIFLDLHMPGKTGLDVLKLLKADTQLSGIPVIILTTSMQKEEEALCRQAGCAKYFSKPVQVEGYGYIINEAIGVLVEHEAALI